MCLSHFRFDCKVTPTYFVESFFHESDHEVYIYILDRLLFLSDTKNVTFIWMEAHEPILFPSCSCIKVLLKISSITDKVYLFVFDTFICK